MTTTPDTHDLPGPAPAAQPAVAVAVPAEPREYHHALRRPGVRRWRGAVAILVAVVGYLLISVVLGMAAGMIGVATGETTVEEMTTQPVLTPYTLLAVNLTAAAMIPVSMLIQRLFFGVRGADLHSVRAMFRWRVLGRIALVVVPVWLVYVIAGTLIGMPGQPSVTQLDISIAMLLIVLTTTWAQAAGEEYLFRGLIARSVGSWFANPIRAFVVATLVSNLLFTVAHTAADPWLIVYYFVFGVSCSVIVWRTGGLEAAALVHAVNNIVFFLAALAYSGDRINMDRSAGVGGAFMLVPMAMLVLAAVGISLWARRAQLQRTTRPGQIVPPEPTTQPEQAIRSV